MAETAILTWNYSGKFYFRITYDVLSQDIASVTSSVRIRLQSKGNSRTYQHYLDASVTIGGVNRVYRVKDADLRVDRDSDSYVTLASWDVTVQHDSLGNGKLHYHVENPPSGAQYSNWGISVPGKYGTTFSKHSDLDGDVTLPAIPRASNYSSVPSAVTTGGTFSASVNRKVSTFWHKISFIYNGTTLYTTPAFETNTSYTIPKSWMQRNVNSTYLNVTARLKTYSEQACTNQIGNAVDAAVTINADASIAPAITDHTIEAVHAFALNGYIRGYSKAQAAVTASDAAGQGAEIVSFTLAIAGQTVTEDEGSLITPQALNVAGTVPYTITVTDQRGRTAVVTGEISVYAYAVPTVSVSEAYRSDAQGDEDDSSHRLALKASGGFSSLGGQNSVTITAAADGNSFSLTSGVRYITDELFDPDDTLYVVFSVTDVLGNTAAYTKVLPTRVWALQFYDGGTGASFGKAVEHQYTLEVPTGWVIRIGDTTLSESELIALKQLI